MTTQNNEPESSDINEIVVQQSPDSETTIASTEAEVVAPANMQEAQAETTTFHHSEDQIQEEPLLSFADYIEEFRQKEGQFGSHDVEIQSGIQIAGAMSENGNGVEESAEVQVTPASEAGAGARAASQASPLMRSSSRARSPRQVGMRHHEVPEAEGKKQQEQNGDVAIENSSVVAETGTVVEPPIEEKPRPERRYRFDRRTPGASTSATTQARIEESKVNTPLSQNAQRTSNELPGEKEAQVAQPSDVAVQPTDEVSTPLEGALEQVEVQTPEPEKAISAKGSHDARRRNAQDREREKAQAAPSVSESATT